MRVALDAGPLVLTSGGLRRYVAELAGAMRTFSDPPGQPGTAGDLVTGAFRDEILLMSDQPFTLPTFLCAGPRNWLERRWWFWGAERVCSRERVDVFHGTNFAVPYRARRATVLTLHDLSPWMDPAWHAGADRVRHRAPGMIKRHATMIIAPSEAVRQQAIAKFGLAPGRVAAVPHAASAHFRPVPGPAVAPYFLFVGTLEPRKNIAALLQAWRHLPPVRLLIAGRRREDFPQPDPEPGVEWLGEVPESRLPELYSGALAVVYPSLYEGFGLPVLEAMQCGACVITSTDPAIVEVAGGAAIHVSGAVELAAAMRSVIEQPEKLASFREKGLRRAAEYSWDRTARATREVYQEAVARYARQ